MTADAGRAGWAGTDLEPAAQQFAALAAGAPGGPAGGVVLTSISAWRHWKWDAANDRDYTGQHIQTTQHKGEVGERNSPFTLSFVIAIAAKQSTGPPLDCFAAIAMTRV